MVKFNFLEVIVNMKLILIIKNIYGIIEYYFFGFYRKL